MTRSFVVALLVGAQLLTPAVHAQTPQAPDRRPDVVYVPTRAEVVESMLDLAGVKAGDVVYDLGCGDGRFVISAARRGARGVGIDIDPVRVKEATENVKKSGVADRVRIVQGDLFLADIGEATVVTLYLLPTLNLRLRPKLWKELKPGTRVVSNMFDMGDWKPDRTINIGNGTAYLWTIPPDAAARAAAEEKGAK
jgi:precorrin-6B methylase 2